MQHLPDEEPLTVMVSEIASEYRVTALLRSEGWRLNHKRVERIWRQMGLESTSEAASSRQHQETPQLTGLQAPGSGGKDAGNYAPGCRRNEITGDTKMGAGQMGKIEFSNF